MGESEFWDKYRADPTPANRNLLVEFYQRPYLQGLASKLACELKSTVEVDDLMQSGTLGLMEAIEDYKDGYGAKFTTFAHKRIIGSMLDGIRSLDSVKRQGRRKINRVRRGREQFVQANGRAPTVHELSEMIGLTPKQIDTADGWMATEQSLFDTPQIGQAAPVKLVTDRNTLDPAEDAAFRDLSQVLLAQLEPRERLLFKLFRLEGQTMKVASRACGFCESRGSQLMLSVEKRIQARINGSEAEVLGAA